MNKQQHRSRETTNKVAVENYSPLSVTLSCLSGVAGEWGAGPNIIGIPNN